MTRPDLFFRPDSKFFHLSKKMVRNFSTKKVGTKIYIWLSMALIVCFKIKHGGFDSHMHSTSLYHPSPSISKTIPTYPTPPLFFWGGGHVTGTRHIFYLVLSIVVFVLIMLYINVEVSSM